MSSLVNSRNSSINHHSFWQHILHNNFGKIIVGAEIVVDVLTVFLSFLGAYGLYVLQFEPHVVEWKQYTRLATIIALLTVIIFDRFGLYRNQMSMMNLLEIRKVVRAIFILFLGLVVYSYYFEIGYSRLTIIYSLVGTMFFVIVERMVFFKLQQYFHEIGVNTRRVLIFGAGESGRLICQNISQAPKLGLRVAGFIDNDQQELSIARSRFSKEQHSDHFFAEDPAMLPEIVKLEQIDEIFVTTPLSGDDHDIMVSLRKLFRHTSIKLNFIPYLRGYFAEQIQVIDVNGVPMISFGDIQIRNANQLSKRVFDLLMAGLLTLLLLPIFSIIAVAIKRDSEGSVFFKQTRVGKDGRHFSIWKFRTMYTNTQNYEKSPSSSRDERITTIGRFLRKSSLDELPQLINVLRGEMSLVGPRPEMPFIVENEYNDLHRERLKVKPGITGVWQISGDRTRDIHENISYDIFYLENRSFLLDIIIIVRTIIWGILSMRTH